MKLIGQLTVALAVALAAPAWAQGVQLTATRCVQFEQMQPEQRRLIAAWLVGYYTEEQDSDLFSEPRVVDVNGKLADFCSKNPNFTLASAAEGLLSK